MHFHIWCLPTIDYKIISTRPHKPLHSTTI
jgi:hypothetical protein